MNEARWYVVHTYSGYEKKVKANIEKAIENRHLEDKILDVRVPMQDVYEVKNGVQKQTQKKVLPGYVLIRMDVDDGDAWYVVRNTRGVTGFVGPGSKPVPLSEEEMQNLGIGQNGQQITPTKPKIKVDYSEGDIVIVVAGAWSGTVGTITAVNPQRQKATINVEAFGREIPVEIDFLEIKKK